MAVGKSRSRGGKKSKRVIIVGKRRRRVSGVGATAVGRTRRRHHHMSHIVGKRRRSRKVSGIGSLTGKGSIFTKMIHVVGGIGVGAYGAHFVLNPVRNWIANNFPVLAPAVKLMETAAGFYMIVMGKSLFIKAAGAGMIASEAIVKATQHLIPGIAGYDQDYHMIKLPISGEVENMLAGLLHNSDRPVYTHQVSGLHVTPQVSGPTMTPQISSTEEVEELQTYPNARW